MVPGDGVEPPPAGPQPAALPLSYRRVVLFAIMLYDPLLNRMGRPP
jgi:hypothetical protein